MASVGLIFMLSWKPIQIEGKLNAWLRRISPDVYKQRDKPLSASKPTDLFWNGLAVYLTHRKKYTPLPPTATICSPSG
jgi:hypothetical protein